MVPDWTQRSTAESPALRILHRSENGRPASTLAGLVSSSTCRFDSKRDRSALPVQPHRQSRMAPGNNATNDLERAAICVKPPASPCRETASPGHCLSLELLD